MPRKTFEYLLGDSREEAARLRVQSHLWDPTPTALFDLGLRRDGSASPVPRLATVPPTGRRAWTCYAPEGP